MSEQGDLTLTFKFNDDGSVEVKRVIKDVEDSLQHAGAGAAAAGQGFNTMRDSVDNSVSGLSKLKDVMGQGVKALQGWGIAWSVFGGFAFMGAKKVDDALDSIRGRTGLTGAALESLQKSFKKVAVTVPQDMGATAQVMITLTQLTGTSGEQMEGLATQILKMSSVLGVDAVSSAESFIKTITKWNIPLTQAPVLMDYLMKVSQKTGVSMGQLTGTMAYTASTMQELGLSFKTGAALIGNLEKAGINSTMMFMMLRNSLKEAAKGGESMSTLFKKVITEIKTTTDETKANALATQYFGRTWMDAKKAIQEGRFEVEGLVQALDASSESVSKAYEDTRSFSEIWGELKNKLIIALEPLGKQLMLLGEKYLPKIIGFIEKWSAKFDEMSDSGKKTTAWIIAIGGPLGTWLNTFVRIVDSAGKMGKLFAGLATFIGPTGLLITGTYMAAYNFGKWLDSLPIIHKWSQSVGETIAVQLGYYEKIRAINAGMMAGTQDPVARQAKNMLFLSTATEIAGHKITDMHMAMDILKKKFAETGTTGNKTLDEWAAKTDALGQWMAKLVTSTAQATAGARTFYEIFRLLLAAMTNGAVVLPQLGAAIDTTTSGMAKLKETLKELGITLRSDIVEQYKKAKEILDRFSGSNALTRTGLEALKDTVTKLKIELETASAAEKAWYLLRTQYGIKSTEDSARAVEDLMLVYKDLEERYKLGRVGIQDYQKVHEQLIAKLKEEGVATEALNLVRSAPAKLDTSWGTEGIGIWKNLVDQISKYRVAWELLGRTGGQTMAMARKEVQGLTDDFLLLSLSAATPDTMVAQWGRIATVFDNMGLSTKEAKKATIEYLDTLYKAAQVLMELQGISLPDIDWSKIIKGAEEAGAKSGSGFATNLKDALEPLGILFGLLAEEMSESFGEGITESQKNLVELVSGLGRLAEGLNAIPDLAKASMKDLADAITPALGMIGGAIGGLISGTKKNFASLGASIGSTLGGILGPVGKMIGGFVGGVLGGIFKKSQTDMERWATEGASAFEKFATAGKKASDALNEAFAKLRKEGFAATAAEAILLSDVMNEMGVDTSNIEKYWQESLNAISQVTAGLLTQGKASEVLAKDWDILIAKAIEFGTEGSAGMIKFIQETRRAGIEIKSMTDYINNQLGVVKSGATNAADGLLAMAGAIAPSLEGWTTRLKDATENQSRLTKELKGVKAGSDEWKKLTKELSLADAKLLSVKEHIASMATASVGRLRNLEAQTLSVFNAMIASGVSFGDAMNSIGPTLDAIIAKEKDLGIAAGSGIKELVKIRGVMTAHKGLFAAISGNLAVLNALGNTASLTQNSLNASAQATKSYYNQLIKSGLTANQSLAQMAPTLSQLAYYADQYGLKLDAGTQKLIDQARGLGLIKEASLDTNTIMMAGFGEIIKALGGDIPAAFQKAMDKVKDFGTGTKKTMEDPVVKSIDNVQVHLASNITGIPRSIATAKDAMKRMGQDSMKLMGAPVITTIGRMTGSLEEFREKVIGGNWTIPIKSGGEEGGGGGKSGKGAQIGFEGYLPQGETFTTHPGEYMKIWPASQVIGGKPIGASGLSAAPQINVFMEPFVVEDKEKKIINYVVKKVEIVEKKIERGDYNIPMGSIRGRA